jgi:hypothetical protein
MPDSPATGWPSSTRLRANPPTPRLKPLIREVHHFFRYSSNQFTSVGMCGRA